MRQAYFQAMSGASMAKYLPATHKTVIACLEDCSKQKAPVKRFMKETIAMAIALNCGVYDPDIATKEAALLFQAFGLFGLYARNKKVSEVSEQMSALMQPLVDASVKDAAEMAR